MMGSLFFESSVPMYKYKYRHKADDMCSSYYLTLRMIAY